MKSRCPFHGTFDGNSEDTRKEPRKKKKNKREEHRKKKIKQPRDKAKGLINTYNTSRLAPDQQHWLWLIQMVSMAPLSSVLSWRDIFALVLNFFVFFFFIHLHSSLSPCFSFFLFTLGSPKFYSVS